MNFKKIRHDLLAMGARIAFTCAVSLPRSIGIKLFGVLGAIAFSIPNRERRLTIEHLRYIYGDTWSSKKVIRCARQVWVHLGKNLFDGVYLPRLTLDKFDSIVSHDDLSQITEAYNRGKGVIAITAHIGCFEMLLHFFAMRGMKSFAVGRRMFDERLEELVRRTRSGNNIEYMDRSESTRKIIRLLSEGKIFGVLVDQDTAVEGVFARFLGRRAYTPSGPIKMAMKTGIPVFVITTIRNKDESHRVIISKQLQLDNTGNLARDLVTNVQKANDLLCETITNYPEQWVWMHPRWRHTPQDKGFENVFSFES